MQGFHKKTTITMLAPVLLGFGEGARRCGGTGLPGRTPWPCVTCPLVRVGLARRRETKCHSDRGRGQQCPRYASPPEV